MAIQPLEDQNSSPTAEDVLAIGHDATATFEPAGSLSNPTEYASSDNLSAAPRTPALDEEDEAEDDDADADADADDDLEDDDDDVEDDEDDDEVEDADDDLEDDDEDDDDEDDEEEDEDDEDA